VGDGLGDGVVGVLGLGDVDGDADGVRSAGRSPRRSDLDSEQAAANVVTRASRQKPESSFFIRYVPPSGHATPGRGFSNRCALGPRERRWCTLGAATPRRHGGFTR